MTCEEILKAVFPLLECTQLANCMLVCKQWRDAAQDDYLWKSLCSKIWPSFCKRQSPPTLTYYKLFQTFYKRQCHRSVPPPKLTLNDLEFYIDIWVEEKIIFSDVVPGPVLPKWSWISPPGTCDELRILLGLPDYRMILPFEPRLTIPLYQSVRVSVYVGRRDTTKVTCIFRKAKFVTLDRTYYRMSDSQPLEIPTPVRLVLPFGEMLLCLLSMDHSNEAAVDVFAIEIRFCADSEDELLLLFDMLEWK
ncbi:F-box protein At5g39250-like [Lycium ferocissimum]|uniref:F-box protein At5g39250-like n=1 Tax=Lycium ferocissimum TaxID=112874 RepID=UPI002814D364|nr:F-box protein At5g39250-like [Lycium ferocissimum]